LGAPCLRQVFDLGEELAVVVRPVNEFIRENEAERRGRNFANYVENDVSDGPSFLPDRLRKARLAVSLNQAEDRVVDKMVIDQPRPGEPANFQRDGILAGSGKTAEFELIANESIRRRPLAQTIADFSVAIGGESPPVRAGRRLSD